LKVEVKALQSKAVAEAHRKEPSIRVPSVLRETHNGFIMSWAGDTDLRTAYKTDDSMDMAAIGARLGRWLACLHHAGISVGLDGWNTQHDTLEKLFSGPGGMEEQAIRSVLPTEDEVERVLKLSRTPPPVRTLTPWDFRPSNVVLRTPNKEEAVPNMTIVDWELCHYGDPTNDLRTWVAEAMVMEAQHGDRGLLSSFLTAYRRHAGISIIDSAFIRKVAVAVGVFLLYFIGQGAVLWGFTEKDNQEWTEKAIQYLKAGADDDTIWLGQSSLKPLLD
jgi:aminoglycoside phosphotransferase (APT) family kinase protein